MAAKTTLDTRSQRSTPRRNRRYPDEAAPRENPLASGDPPPSDQRLSCSRSRDTSVEVACSSSSPSPHSRRADQNPSPGSKPNAHASRLIPESEILHLRRPPSPPSAPLHSAFVRREQSVRPQSARYPSRHDSEPQAKQSPRSWFSF